MTYEIIYDDFGNEMLKATEASGKVWYVPKDPNNTMYKAYLESLKK